MQQISTQPKQFLVKKDYGPTTAEIIMPDDVTDALVKMSDGLFEDSAGLSHGQNLAGVIATELRVHQADLINAGCYEWLESAVRGYVQNSAVMNGQWQDDYEISSNINSCWTVNQFANEYNPLHNHTNCEISAVCYLKIPDVKGRRNLDSKKGKQDEDGNITFMYSASSNMPGDIFSIGITSFIPAAGTLLIFPSYLLHQVYPFIGEGERRSMAFNANYQIKTKHGGFIAGNQLGRPLPSWFIEGKQA